MMERFRSRHAPRSWNQPGWTKWCNVTQAVRSFSSRQSNISLYLEHKWSHQIPYSCDPPCNGICIILPLLWFNPCPFQWEAKGIAIHLLEQCNIFFVPGTSYLPKLIHIIYQLPVPCVRKCVSGSICNGASHSTISALIGKACPVWISIPWILPHGDCSP